MNASGQAEAELLCPHVSRETWERLGVYVALLERWQATINLVGPLTLAHVWTRHVVDSLQLLPLAPAARRWVDLGAGAGLPGLPIAAALAAIPDAMVELVESDQRKAAFLREAARVMEVPARIHVRRAEDWAPAWNEPVDVVTARALAPLDRLIPLAQPLLIRGARGMFLKGRNAEEELTAAARSWHIGCQLVRSVTDSAAWVVVVSDIRPRDVPDRGSPTS